MDIITKIKNIEKNNIKKLYELYNELYNELTNSIDKDYLDYLFYSLKNYEYKKIIETEIIEEKEKRLDKNFRQKIINKYNNCCIVTQKPLYICQVAHIYPYAKCEFNEKYDESNGLLLSVELHILFDNDKFKIEPETQIITFTDDILNDTTMNYYKKYHNKLFPYKLTEKNIYFLKKKYHKNIIN